MLARRSLWFVVVRVLAVVLALDACATIAHASNKRATRPAKARRPAKPGKTPDATASGATWIFQPAANLVPNQHGNVVVFPFRNDDDEAISRQVGQLLAARGLDIMTGVRRVDTSEQYRDMATHLDLVAYVDGDVRGSDSKTRVTVRLRSGYTGRPMSQAAFVAERAELPRELADKLWTKLGRAVARACKDAEKPRKRSRTLQIDAGTPIEPATARSTVSSARH